MNSRGNNGRHTYARPEAGLAPVRRDVSEFMDSGLMKGRPAIMEWWERESDGTVGEMET